MKTERERINELRAAFIAGAAFQEARHRAHRECPVLDNLSWSSDEAEKRFPLPKITRLRVVADTEDATGDSAAWGAPREWTVRGGQLVSRTIGWRIGPLGQPEHYAWNHMAQCRPTPKRVALWADLLASPTETVEDDGSASSQGEE